MSTSVSLVSEEAGDLSLVPLPQSPPSPPGEVDPGQMILDDGKYFEDASVPDVAKALRLREGLTFFRDQLFYSEWALGFYLKRAQESKYWKADPSSESVFRNFDAWLRYHHIPRAICSRAIALWQAYEVASPYGIEADALASISEEHARLIKSRNHDIQRSYNAELDKHGSLAMEEAEKLAVAAAQAVIQDIIDTPEDEIGYKNSMAGVTVTSDVKDRQYEVWLTHTQVRQGKRVAMIEFDDDPRLLRILSNLTKGKIKFMVTEEGDEETYVLMDYAECLEKRSEFAGEDAGEDNDDDLT